MGLEVKLVESKRDLRTFVKLPWQIYRAADNWVPPLIAQQKRLFDRQRNPFFEHATADYFLAWRDGRPVGRICAHIDRNFNEYQQNKWGLFGFFECENDPAAAQALFAAAAESLQVGGCDRIIGPFDFSTNDQCGMLVEGHEHVPTILTAWHHPYYQTLISDAGLTKVKDLQMWKLNPAERSQVFEIMWELADKVEKEHGIQFRSMRKSNFAKDLASFVDVYHEAWAKNWAFVPMTQSEVEFNAKELKPIIDEGFTYLAEKDGEVIGAALTLPDYNQVLRHLNGRLLPFGWIKALYYKRQLNKVRVMALGVRKEYQHTGVAARFYQMNWDHAQKTGLVDSETGWILEDNKPMNRGMEAMGGEVTRKYRIYERIL